VGNNHQSLTVWQQGAIIVGLFGVLFWLGYNYSTIQSMRDALDRVAELQRDVRERLSRVESEHSKWREALPPLDKSGEYGGRSLHLNGTR
jgi:hypothetical protein